jgi:uncharacterized protein YoxC
MTVQVDITTLIILAVVILFAAFLLPMIWQLKKTGREAEALLSELRQDLIPTLRDFREITERINRASVKIEKGSGHAENFLESLDEIVDSIRQISHIFHRDASRVAENASFLILGVKAASKVFLKGPPKKGD